MSFGEQLASVRRGSGLTQEQFAEQLQVSRQAVSKWESGRGYPEIEKILYICNRYQVSIADMFAEEAPPPALSAAPDVPAVPEQSLPRESLHTAISTFLTNLSPKNKWLAAGVLVGVGALSGLIGLCLKGGNTDMSTIVWIAAIVIFGVVEAATAGHAGRHPPAGGQANEKGHQAHQRRPRAGRPGPGHGAHRQRCAYRRRLHRW